MHMKLITLVFSKNQLKCHFLKSHLAYFNQIWQTASLDDGQIRVGLNERPFFPRATLNNITTVDMFLLREKYNNVKCLVILYITIVFNIEGIEFYSNLLNFSLMFRR